MTCKFRQTIFHQVDNGAIVAESIYKHRELRCYYLVIRILSFVGLHYYPAFSQLKSTMSGETIRSFIDGILVKEIIPVIINMDCIEARLISKPTR